MFHLVICSIDTSRNTSQYTYRVNVRRNRYGRIVLHVTWMCKVAVAEEQGNIAVVQTCVYAAE